MLSLIPLTVWSLLLLLQKGVSSPFIKFWGRYKQVIFQPLAKLLL